MHFAPGFEEAWKVIHWQWLQGGLFTLLKVGFDLLARGAVDALVGPCLLPVAQVGVDFEE